MTPNIEKYVVLAEDGVSFERADGIKTYAKGETLELDPTNEKVQVLLETGAIAPLYEGELEDFTITEEFLAKNPSFADQGHVVGDVIQLPKETAPITDTGSEVGAKAATSSEVDASEAVETETETETETAEVIVPVEEVIEETHVTTDVSALNYKHQGMAVVSNGMRTVNDKEYHHVRLADGSEHDLTNEEYSAMLAAAQ